MGAIGRAQSSIRQASRPSLGLLVLGAMVMLVSIPACSFVAGNQPETNPAKPTKADTYSPTVSAPVINVGVCIDPTLSTNTSFSQTIESLVAQVVAGWAESPPPPTITTALSPRSGLNLWLRQVETNSFDSSNAFLHFVIPSVPELQARLDATDPNFINDDPLWVKARSSVIGQATAASQASSAGAKAIQSWPLETWQTARSPGASAVWPTRSPHRVGSFWRVTLSRTSHHRLPAI
jgi:hypothetical protein